MLNFIENVVTYQPGLCCEEGKRLNMNKKLVVIIIIAILFIIFGIFLFCYPSVSNYIYEQDVQEKKEEFVVKISADENVSTFDKLYQELQNRNQELYENKQENLVDPFSYEQPTIDLSEYGINDNIIGYIRIPKMNVELPILLGANSVNMKKGAVHLTETSYPIGGANTNSVIAAHRGYGKAVLFRNIDKLVVGDKIYIQNFKEELSYEVYDIKLVDPDDTSELLILEGEDIITLITCHPYRVNTQRYIVKAKRILN